MNVNWKKNNEVVREHSHNHPINPRLRPVTVITYTTHLMCTPKDNNNVKNNVFNYTSVTTVEGTRALSIEHIYSVILVTVRRRLSQSLMDVAIRR